MNCCSVHAELRCRVIETGLALLDAFEEERCKMEEKKKKRRRNLWVKQWVARRSKLGGEVLLRELATEDEPTYTNTLRMNVNQFNELLTMIEGTIQKQDTQMRLAITARLKLEVTLRYLATGDSFRSLALFFRLPISTISTFLPHVLRAMTASLSHYMKFPETTEEWKKIASLFARRWNFPRCCAAIDGKHINIKQPPASGSRFYNYKGTYSIVLFAAVDADYNFIYVNVGTNGRANDAGIFQDSSLFKGLENETLNLPDRHVILGDSAFPLKPYLMKPYSRLSHNSKQVIFNYRLSRARRIVENAFGILAWRFRVFLRTIELKEDTVDEIVLAACSLHNWLRTFSPTYLTSTSVDQEDGHTGEIIPGLWRSEINELPSVEKAARSSNNYTKSAERIRSQYAEYFCTEGAIVSQWRATGLRPEDMDNIEENDVNNSEEGGEIIDDPSPHSDSDDR